MSAVSKRFELIVKKDCPTCELIAPVCWELQNAGLALIVYTQDDPTFPQGIDGVVDDRELDHSYERNVEIVPTLIRVEAEHELERTYGWDRDDWEKLTGLSALGADLPPQRPGCGSLSVEPGIAERLAIKFGDARFTARELERHSSQDDIEMCFDRGWSDGLPTVPPTPLRVLRMLQGASHRSADEVIGQVPPSMAPCTVEKIAINAVLAGCKPEYFPVVLAAVEAVLEPAFSMHGVLATTSYNGPLVIVNGPIAKRIGMNCGINALGQGNRANATIGRAVQLVVRNMGGGIPGGVDRATLGQPGKLGWCFAEDESDANWEPLSVARGFDPGVSTATVFPGGGVQVVWDQASRGPQSLTRSIAMSMQAVGHPKHVHYDDVLLVLSPEHFRIYDQAGWTRQQIEDALLNAVPQPGRDLIRGAHGIDEGMPNEYAEGQWSKFRPGDLHLVRAGGPAGLSSAIIPGWFRDSVPVTKEISS